jgi:hypothetical protein
VVLVDAAQAVAEVEPFVLPAGTDAQVGRRPTIGVVADAASRWGEEDGTPFGTLAWHCWMKLP